MRSETDADDSESVSEFGLWSAKEDTYNYLLVTLHWLPVMPVFVYCTSVVELPTSVVGLATALAHSKSA